MLLIGYFIMAKCVKITRTSKRVCIGALNKKITIKIRTLTPPVGGHVDYGETFTDFKEVWAMCDTVTGVSIFDNATNIERTITNDFYIRFIPDITIEEWVQYSNNYYDIVLVENFGIDDRFYRIRTVLRGPTDKPINKA